MPSRLVLIAPLLVAIGLIGGLLISQLERQVVFEPVAKHDDVIQRPEEEPAADEKEPLEPVTKEPKKVEEPKTTPSAVAAVSDSQRQLQAELAAETKAIFRSRCADCHGIQRAESGLNVLNVSTYVEPDGLVVPGNSTKSELYERIVTEDDSYRMPEEPLPPLSADEKETIRRWIDAGAPEFPADVAQEDSGTRPSTGVGSEYVLSRILSFAENVAQEDRRYLRFFSANHLIAEGVTQQELTQFGYAFAKAINHLSWKENIVKPSFVDEAGSIFAVDIRQLGWDVEPFAPGDGKASGNLDLFDLVLLEYPYGVAYRNLNAFRKLLKSHIEPAGMVRPISYVRVDWFISVATQAPLYEDLLQLPRTLPELEELIGVDAEDNLATGLARRAGMTYSGVSRNNRVVERHPANMALTGRALILPPAMEARISSRIRSILTLPVGR